MANRKTVEGRVPFGHCLTGNHDRCEVTIVNQYKKTVECVCDCENHGVNYKPSPPPSDRVLAVLKEYGLLEKYKKYAPE